MKLTKETYFIFSGGEVHTKVVKTDRNIIPYSHIICLDYSMNGFMALCQQAQILKNMYGTTCSVTYPYFPYARQDRWIGVGEPFSLKIFTELLNSRNFSSVTVCDPHSDVVGALIDNCIIIEQHHIAKRIIPEKLLSDHNVMFVSPDAGSYKKLSKLIDNDYRIVVGTKIRGTDGRIIKTGIHSPCNLAGKTCVVVDDICDGGRTFLELGKELKRKGAEKLILYVTHGIFSNGIDELLSLYSQIYTTASFDQSKYAQNVNLVVKGNVLSC